jgi:hypothetical protein
MNDELVRQCVEDIIEQAMTVKEEPRGLFRDGKLLAYNEILSILKINLTPIGPENYGLDFDIDTKFA